MTAKKKPTSRSSKEPASQVEARVVAIEGTLSPTRTPALRGPVLLDSRRRRVVEEDGAFVVVTTEPVDVPVGEAALLSEGIPARVGHTCLVLGERDQAACEPLARHSNPELSSFARWLAGDRAVDATRAAKAADGPYVVWHCSLDHAHEVMGLLREAAQRELVAALRAKDSAAVYAQAFRLQRASTNAATWLLGALALERVAHHDAARVLRATALKHLPTPHERHLASAVAELDELLSAGAPPLHKGSLRELAARLCARQTQPHAAA